MKRKDDTAYRDRLLEYYKRTRDPQQIDEVVETLLKIKYNFDKIKFVLEF